MDVEKIADELMALNNASPRLSRKDQILQVLLAHAAQEQQNYQPKLIVRGCQPGATVTVINDGTQDRITTNGWVYGVRNGETATQEEITVAILDFLRAALTFKKVQAGALN